MRNILVIAALSLTSAFAIASTFNDDLDLVWLSWCEKGNVMQSDAQGKPEIRMNCAQFGQDCRDYQRTNGKRVYYSAMCVDRDDNGN